MVPFSPSINEIAGADVNWINDRIIMKIVGLSLNKIVSSHSIRMVPLKLVCARAKENRFIGKNWGII
jgi:hypothetical protein